jgi:toxin YoeB
LTLEVRFTANGAEDYDFWERTDQRALDKIKALIRDVREHPFSGLGKPEPLKFDFAGCWS